MSKLTKGYGSTGIQAILGDIKTYLTTILADYATTVSVTSAIATKADLVDGKVADEQIPDSVHDTEIYDDVEDFPLEGLVGKIYIALRAGSSYVYSEDKDEYTFTDGNMGTVTIDNTGGEELPVSAELTVTQYMGGESLTYNGNIGFYNSYPDQSVPPYLAVGSRQILDKAGKDHLNVGDKIVLYKYDGITRCVYRCYENGIYTDFDVSDCIFNAYQYTPDHDQYLIANSVNTFTIWTSGPWTVSSALSVLKGGSYQAVGNNVQPDWSQTNATADDYIKNKPTLASVATSGSYNDLNDKPSIPDELSDLTEDTTHRTVTDAEKIAWNSKSDFSGSYDDLADKPIIPDVSDLPDWEDLSDDVTVNVIPKKGAGTYTHNGITYVVDSDGRITANGTASSTANSLFTVATTIFKSGKRYWLTGCPEGGSNNSYFIICGDGTNNVREYGSGVYFTATASDTVIQIVIAKGVTVTDLVFEPMLVLEKHKGESFVSHIPSNKELADKPWTKLGEVTGTSPDYEDSSTFNLSALQNKDVLMIFSVDEGSLTAKQGIITLEYSAFEFNKILQNSVQEEDEITRLWKGVYGGAPRESVATFEEFLRGLGYIYIATHSTTAEIGAKIYGAYDWTLEIYTK